MVTITSLAKDERSARVALASTLEPDDAVTGRLLAAVGAVETVRLAAGAGALPKNVDAVEARLWRNKVAPRMDARTVTQALAETDRLGLRILIPSDDEWPTALNDLGVTGMTVTQVMGCGIQKGTTEKYRGVPVDSTLLPKIKVEVIVSKISVDAVVDAAKKALYTGHIGDGKIFVYNVTRVVKIRTGEEDFAALQDVE